MDSICLKQFETDPKFRKLVMENIDIALLAQSSNGSKRYNLIHRILQEYYPDEVEKFLDIEFRGNPKSTSRLRNAYRYVKGQKEVTQQEREWIQKDMVPQLKEIERCVTNVFKNLKNDIENKTFTSEDMAYIANKCSKLENRSERHIQYLFYQLNRHFLHNKMKYLTWDKFKTVYDNPEEAFNALNQPLSQPLPDPDYDYLDNAEPLRHTAGRRRKRNTTRRRKRKPQTKRYKRH